MPIFNFFHWSKDAGETLERTGPLLAVEIRLPSALETFCAEKNLNIPPPTSGYALIDTGVFAMAVDEKVFTDLGVPPIDTIETKTPHGPGKSNVYPAVISFPTLELNSLPLSGSLDAIFAG
jgi:hypothetical protein